MNIIHWLRACWIPIKTKYRPQHENGFLFSVQIDTRWTVGSRSAAFRTKISAFEHPVSPLSSFVRRIALPEIWFALNDAWNWGRCCSGISDPVHKRQRKSNDETYTDTNLILPRIYFESTARISSSPIFIRNAASSTYKPCSHDL